MTAALKSNHESKVSETESAKVHYVLEIKDLSKTFRRSSKRRESYTTLKSLLLGFFKTSSASAAVEETRAVQNLTVRVPKGASVGIIGRNGSGKSTLLKLITGIYKPSSGVISVEGRVAALIELGTGFHPDFTGRENVYLSGVMHGLSRAQIDERFDDIVEFAELKDFIDDPVRTYSSGMFMRLGFSLAIHTDPDILLIDEVLAVGDAGFTAKCKERISELKKEGKTLLLVSHDLESVERWCDEAIWLDKGIVKDRGDPRRVIDHYRQFIEKGEEEQLIEAQGESYHRVSGHGVSGGGLDSEGPKRWGGREIAITGARLLNSENQPHLLFHTDDRMIVELDYEVKEPQTDIVFGVAVSRADGLLVFGTNTDIERIAFAKTPTKGIVRLELDRLGLLEGRYRLDLAVHKQDGYPYDYHQGIVEFAVRSPLRHVGVSIPTRTWSIAEAKR